MELLTLLASALILVLLFLLFIPIDLELYALISASPRYRIRFGWLVGLVWKEITKSEETAKKEVKPKKEKAKKVRGIKLFIVILRTKGFIESLGLFIKRAISSLKIKFFKSRLRVGFADPADTGMLFALFWPLRFSIKSVFPIDGRIEPSFDEEVFEGYIQGVVRIRPFKIIISFLRFAVSLSTFRLVKNVAVMKWK
jgi:hypothetical protein